MGGGAVRGGELRRGQERRGGGEEGEEFTRVGVILQQSSDSTCILDVV